MRSDAKKVWTLLTAIRTVVTILARSIRSAEMSVVGKTAPANSGEIFILSWV
jgi:hypothetical protein